MPLGNPPEPSYRRLTGEGVDLFYHWAPLRTLCRVVVYCGLTCNEAARAKTCHGNAGCNCGLAGFARFDCKLREFLREACIHGVSGPGAFYGPSVLPA